MPVPILDDMRTAHDIIAMLPDDVHAEVIEGEVGVLDFPSAHSRRAEPGGLPVGPQFGDLHREPALRLAGAREQRLHCLGQPRPDARWPGHLQRRGPAGELAVEDQERQPAEMVTVQVGHCHGIDGPRIQPLGLERHQAGSAAIDQQHLSFPGHVDTRLPPPPITERIPAANETDPHDGILTHPAGNRTGTPRSAGAVNQPSCAVRLIHGGRDWPAWR